MKYASDFGAPFRHINRALSFRFSWVEIQLIDSQAARQGKWPLGIYWSSLKLDLDLVLAQSSWLD